MVVICWMSSGDDCRGRFRRNKENAGKRLLRLNGISGGETSASNMCEDGLALSAEAVHTLTELESTCFQQCLRDRPGRR
jgi:hypothetical protein